MAEQINVTGNDGVPPVHEPDSRWTTWALQQIYIPGNAGSGFYIPKLNDYVVDYSTDERYVVTDVDISTGGSTLKKIVGIKDPGDMDGIDVLLGVGPGTQSDTFRAYIDKSVIPHTLAVDARCYVNGSMVSYAKIFKGANAGAGAKVVSAFYDQSGNLLGQNVPLELVAMPNGQNYAVKCPKVCYTSEDLQDNELLTIWFYDDAGGVVSKRVLIVENTAFIRSTDAATKYITGITLESPFMSSSDPNLMEYPINVPLRGLDLFGVVHYSDGSSRRMPVDGTKFSIFGFNDFVATIVGQQIPLVLRYNLSQDEIVYGATAGEGLYITENYKAIATKADGAYTVKLFGYPVWIDSVNGYRLEWFLYNLDRNIYYKVTPYVRFNENSPAFDPIAYGVNQRLSVSINLRDVNGSYNNYIHVQTIDVALMRQGSDHTGTNWTIGFDPGQNPPYARNAHAETTFINQNLWKVKIGLGETTKAAWLERLYSQTKPLTDPAKEVNPPEPDFFALVYGDTAVEFPIAQWNDELTVSNSTPDSSTLYIKFYKRTVENDLQLAMAALPVWQQN